MNQDKIVSTTEAITELTQLYMVILEVGREQ